MVAGTRGPIPPSPDAQFADWSNLVDYRLKNLEGATGSKKGIVAYDTWDANSGDYSATTNTDMILPTVEVFGDRLYRGNLKTDWSLDVAGTWQIFFRVDGVNLNQLDITDSTRDILSASWLWLPDEGIRSCVIRVVEIVGGSVITFTGQSTNHRQFWIEDIGLR